GSIRVAQDKAQTALDFRRPSKVFEDSVALACARSAFAERPHLRVASQLLPTARSLEPSVSRARPLSRIDRLPRFAPILPPPSRCPAPRWPRRRASALICNGLEIVPRCGACGTEIKHVGYDHGQPWTVAKASDRDHRCLQCIIEIDQNEAVDVVGDDR